MFRSVIVFLLLVTSVGKTQVKIINPITLESIQRDSVHTPWTPNKQIEGDEPILWHPRRLTGDYSGWNLLRQKTWMLSDSLIKEFSLPVDQEQLYDYLIDIFYIESNFNPKAKNKASSATGLIQWMHNKYTAYGYTREEFISLGIPGQMKYVGVYMRDRIRRVNAEKLDDWVDYYCLVFYPRAAPASDDYIISQSGSRVYKSNRALDVNKDGFIKKNELCRYLKTRKS